MPRSGQAGRQLKSLLWRASTKDEVDADIAYHLDMLTRELMERGLPEPQARAEAVRRFGDVQAETAESRRLADERDHNNRRAELRVEMLQDLSFAIRQLRNAPMFSAMAVLTLALGFGATAAVFSALYTVVLKPLPFPDSDRVVNVRSMRRGEEAGGTASEFFALQDRSGAAFERLAAQVETGFTVKAGDLPELVSGARVSADYFRVKGVAPAIGRVFTADEDVPGRDNVVVLSHRAWTSRHNADPGIVGRFILVDGAPRTVIGVMPASFALTSDVEDLWVPLALTREAAARGNARYLDVIARLRAGVSLEQAAASATEAMRTAAGADPNRRLQVADYTAVVRRFIDGFIGEYRSLLLILLGAGGFVLLIACTNVANLLIARGSVRSRELAIRTALGAGRRRLLRQLLTESGVLAMAGAALGLALAYGLLQAVLAVSPQGVPRLNEARIDVRVLGFTLLCAAVSTILFGLVPALRLAGANLESVLRAGGRSLHGGRDRLRAALVGVEVALAMTLLVGSGLLIRSALLIQKVEPGFDARGVHTARILLPEAGYAEPGAVVTFYERLHREAAQHPAMSSAALVSMVPMSGNRASVGVFREGQSTTESQELLANLRLTSPEYFGTMRIPLRAGRDISLSDQANAPRVMVINESMAARLWPDVPSRDVVGRRVNAIAPSRNEPLLWEVIGVVGDIRDEALSKDVRPEFYIPVAQTPGMLWPYLQRSLVLVARTRGDDMPAATLERPVREIVAGIDPGLPITESRPMSEFLRGSQATLRFSTLVLGTLGGIALLLAIIGVYGVVSYFVAQRARDIAVRIALGASPANIWSHVAARGLQPLLAGVMFGTVLSLGTARLLQSRLYQVSPTDPWTIGGTALLLVVVSLVALYAPARRAVRVEPVVALSP
jgi:putative ABC transport system permease protein